jgi:L-aminopeptidase/D-esterase-like protein
VGGSLKENRQFASLGYNCTLSTPGYITDVEGIRVGHFTDTRRPTGCTVILCEAGAVTGVDVRGSAPGTRETDLLSPVNTVDKAHAVLLSGGSAFGLEAAAGVVRYLEERNAGFPTRFGRMPIVPAAVLYDLSIGDPKIRPDAEAGYAACVQAHTGQIEEGSVGAGAGATIGKLGAGEPMKGGIGTASVRLRNGLVVGAIVAVNCVGNVIDPRTGKIVAGSRTPDNQGFADIIEWFRSGNGPAAPLENTTIGVVATNARFTKTEMTKVAQMAHDGLARTINPVHTPFDGDTLFAMATGMADIRGDLGMIGALGAEAVAEAVLRAITQAKALPTNFCIDFASARL